jgi:integrase
MRKRKDTGYWFYKLKGWKNYKTTGTRRQDRALEVVQEALSKQGGSTDSLKSYAAPYFLRETCPRTQHLVGEGKSIGDRHLREQRALLDRHILKDALADKPLAEITRGDILEFRGRLLAKLPGRIRTVNKTVGVLKTIFREAVYREDLRSSPVQGIGNTKYQVLKSGVLSMAELKKLFPEDPPGPWKDLAGYTAFLLAAATGMRKGEVLALRWIDIDFDGKLVHVRFAWKDRDQLGIPKGGEERVTPILLWPDRVIARLQELNASRKKAPSPVDLVFSYANGSRMGDTWWQKRWVDALGTTNIDRVGRHLTPHGLRRTLNSLLRAANKDPAKIRAALGWKQESTQNGYTEFKVKDLEDLRLD